MKARYSLLLLAAAVVPTINSAYAQSSSAISSPAISSEPAIVAPTLYSSGPDESPVDTLMQYMTRSTSIVHYTYAPDANKPTMVASVTGTNSNYFMLGQKYDFKGEGTVAELLIGYHHKMIRGEADTLMVGIEACDEDGKPTGQFLAEGTFTTDQIDTSSSMLYFTSIPLEKHAALTSKFIALVQTMGMSSTDETDLTGIFTNQHGDGKKERRVIYVGPGPQAGTISVGELADLYNVNNQPIDIDLMVLPVVELSSAAGIAGEATLNGLTLKGAFPNPAVDASTIALALDRPSQVVIELIDVTGKVVRTLRQPTLSAGEHRISLDLSGLSAGSYLYSVTTSSARVAGRVTVAR